LWAPEANQIKKICPYWGSRQRRKPEFVKYKFELDGQSGNFSNKNIDPTV